MKPPSTPRRGASARAKAAASSGKGVALDPVTGNLIVADSLNHRIRVVDPRSCAVSTLAGGAASGAVGGDAAVVPAALDRNGVVAVSIVTRSKGAFAAAASDAAAAPRSVEVAPAAESATRIAPEAPRPKAEYDSPCRTPVEFTGVPGAPPEHEMTRPTVVALHVSVTSRAGSAPTTSWPLLRQLLQTPPVGPLASTLPAPAVSLKDLSATSSRVRLATPS